MGSIKNQLPTLTLDESKKADPQNGHPAHHSAELIETCKSNAARLAVDDNINVSAFIPFNLLYHMTD